MTSEAGTQGDNSPIVSSGTIGNDRGESIVTSRAMSDSSNAFTFIMGVIGFCLLEYVLYDKSGRVTSSALSVIRNMYELFYLLNKVLREDVTDQIDLAEGGVTL